MPGDKSAKSTKSGKSSSKKDKDKSEKDKKSKGGKSERTNKKSSRSGRSSQAATPKQSKSRSKSRAGDNPADVSVSPSNIDGMSQMKSQMGDADFERAAATHATNPLPVLESGLPTGA